MEENKALYQLSMAAILIARDVPIDMWDAILDDLRGRPIPEGIVEMMVEIDNARTRVMYS